MKCAPLALHKTSCAQGYPEGQHTTREAQKNSLRAVSLEEVSAPCFLLLQMVPFQGNVDVATEILLRDSPVLLDSCTKGRQCFPRAHMPAGLSSLRSAGVAASPLPGSRIRPVQVPWGRRQSGSSRGVRSSPSRLLSLLFCRG